MSEALLALISDSTIYGGIVIALVVLVLFEASDTINRFARARTFVASLEAGRPHDVLAKPLLRLQSDEPVRVGTRYVLEWPRTPVDALRRPSHLRFMPGLLTALGVLGTFAGIVRGLAGIDTGSGDAAFASIQTLIGGMSQAFGTSLAGLFAAVVAMGLLFAFRTARGWSNALRIRTARVTMPASALDPAHGIVDALAGSREMQEAQAEAARELQQVAVSLGQTLERLDPDQIGAAVARSLDPRLGALDGTMDRMVTELHGVQELMRTHNEGVVNDLVTRMRDEVFGPVTERLEQSAETTRQASAAVQALSTELEGTLANLERFQTETLQRLEAFAERMDGTLETFQTRTEGAMQRISDDIRIAVDGSVVSMTEQRSAFRESAAEMVQTFKGATDDVSRNLSETSTAVEYQLDQFRQAYQQQLTTFLEAQNQQLEATLGKQREGLERVVAALNEAIEQERSAKAESLDITEKQLDRLRESSQTIGDLAEAVGLHNAAKMSHVEDGARTVNRTVAELKREVANLARKQEELHRAQLEQFDLGRKALRDYVDASNAHQRVFFKEADEALSRLAQRVAAAAEDVLTARTAQSSQRDA